MGMEQGAEIGGNMAADLAKECNEVEEDIKWLNSYSTFWTYVHRLRGTYWSIGGNKWATPKKSCYVREENKVLSKSIRRRRGINIRRLLIFYEGLSSW